MPIHQTLHKGLIPVHIYTDDIGHDALQQLLNVANLSIVHPHVAAMPDVHYGTGATVGSVIPARGAIIPTWSKWRMPCAESSASKGETRVKS